MKKFSDPRHQARIAALQLLFAKEFSKFDFIENHVEYSMDQLKEINRMDNLDNELVIFLISGVESSKEEIDKVIREKSTKRPLEQISFCDLEILRMALFEGYITKSTPWKVTIDEAVELAKTFGSNKSSNFINGVLGNLQNT